MKNSLIIITTAAATAALVIGTTQPTIVARAQTKRQFLVYAVDSANGLLAGGPGNVALTAVGLENALADASNRGYKVTSVVYNTVMGGYTVIIEK